MQVRNIKKIYNYERERERERNLICSNKIEMNYDVNKLIIK